eukprot:scaffold128558_cov40-Tisochrysis_lutea.AAC.4
MNRKSRLRWPSLQVNQGAGSGYEVDNESQFEVGKAASEFPLRSLSLPLQRPLKFIFAPCSYSLLQQSYHDHKQSFDSTDITYPLDRIPGSLADDGAISEAFKGLAMNMFDCCLFVQSDGRFCTKMGRNPS